MALTLPLQVLDSVRRCYCSIRAGTSKAYDSQLADVIVNEASLFDVFKWQGVSRCFRDAARKRLDAYKKIDVRIYAGLQTLRDNKIYEARYDWHPSRALMLVDLGPSHLGIAIDSKLDWKDVRILLHLLITFRRKVEQLSIDSPIIELLVAEVNKQQVKLLISLLSQSRKASKEEMLSNDTFTVAPIYKNYLPDGPFFPHLKQLSIISQSNQIEHLSHLLSYAVSVDLIYHVEQMDLLCLKICVGKAWSRSRNFRLFRHLTKFRQWTEAGALGERYFQQFGACSVKKRSKSAHDTYTRVAD